MTPTAILGAPIEAKEQEKQTQEQYLREYIPEVQSGVDQGKDTNDALGNAVEAWLLNKHPSISGESTAMIYRKLLVSLRTHLQARGLDLDSPETQLIQQIQTWANQRTAQSKRQGNVAPSTYNQRIAAVNSFYTWARTHGIYTSANPTEQLNRTLVHKYAGSQPLDVQQIRNCLKKIDRSTARGQRDYTLLQVALNTGRSARELASLTWSSLSFQGNTITLSFVGGRGGKIIEDTLDSSLSQILLAYLRTIYGHKLATLNSQAPIWVSFSDRTYHQAIGQQTIADICEKHLGVSKIHQLRHTFAFTMDQLGAPVDIIQTRLGHGSRATTDAYLASLKESYNPYAALLANAFGLTADHSTYSS